MLISASNLKYKVFKMRRKIYLQKQIKISKMSDKFLLKRYNTHEKKKAKKFH